MNFNLSAVQKFLFQIKEYLIIFFVYVVLASQKITNLGLNYDEVLFTNVALGEPSKGLFITHRLESLGNLALHNHYYIGVLKSTLYRPIYALFGGSEMSTRLPMVILTAFSLFLVYFLLQKYLSKTYALLITLVAGLNMDLMFYTTYDVGPVAIELFCKILLIVLMFNYLKNPQWYKVIIFCLVFFAGSFNKLNFLWSGNAVIFGFALIYFPTIWGLMKSMNKSKLALHLSTFIVGLGLTYVYWQWCGKLYGWTGSFGLDSVFQNYVPRFRAMIKMAGGWTFYNWGLEEGDFLRGEILGYLTLIISTLGLFAAWMRSEFMDLRRIYALLYVTFWVIFIQQVATFSAFNTWHTFSSVFPFLPLCFGLGIYVLIKIFLTTPKTQKVTIFSLLGMVLVYHLVAYGQYQRQLDFEPRNSAWSLQFKNLSAYLKSEKRKIVATDWGLTTGLLTLDPRPGKYIDYWNKNDGSYKPEVFEEFKTYLEKPEEYLIISHGPGRRIFRDNNNVLIFLAENGFTLKKVKSFPGGRGEQYELYELERINR